MASTDHGVDRHHEGVDRHPSRDSAISDDKEPISISKVTDSPKEDAPSTSDVSKAKTPPTERVYKPKIPYPKPPKKSEKQIEKEIEDKRQAILRNVIAESPSYGFIKNSPVIKGFIKEMSVSTNSVEESVRTVLKEVNAINMNFMKIAKADPSPPTLKKLDKMESPGRFVFNCSINGMEMKNSLCDTGASCNVMSQAVAQRLGISSQQIPKSPIILADSSPTTAKGFASDVMIRIEDHLVPADFYIMGMDEDINKPLILGSPFLATVGALMDFPNERVSFSKINPKKFYSFHPIKGTSCKAIIHDKMQSSNPKEAAKEVHKIFKDTSSINKPSKVKSKRMPKSYAKISIIIPMELRDKEDDTIKERLQGTMSLFPDISSWQIKGGVLAAKGRYQRFLYDPP